MFHTLSTILTLYYVGIYRRIRSVPDAGLIALLPTETIRVSPGTNESIIQFPESTELTGDYITRMELYGNVILRKFNERNRACAKGTIVVFREITIYADNWKLVISRVLRKCYVMYL